MKRPRSFASRPPRVDLRRPALIVLSDGGFVQVTLLDISRGGFRIESDDPPRVGELVTLKVERSQEFPARICWVLGREAGAAFIDESGE
jgi:hypothetical protein